VIHARGGPEQRKMRMHMKMGDRRRVHASIIGGDGVIGKGSIERGLSGLGESKRIPEGF
jgi:hypothetical protein